MADLITTTTGLWLAVVASGIYHGANPGMGWPLAVSAALMEGRPAALWTALAALVLGHFAAMLAVLLPFSLLAILIDWQQQIRIGAGLCVLAVGFWLLSTRRHPRFLARVPPSRMALWSFLVALAHGAALMLVPIYLGLCGPDVGHEVTGTVSLSMTVALLHSLAMIVTSAGIAWAVHRHLGLRALRRGWFNLEKLWAGSLVVVGGLGVAAAV